MKLRNLMTLNEYKWGIIISCCLAAVVFWVAIFENPGEKLSRLSPVVDSTPAILQSTPLPSSPTPTPTPLLKTAPPTKTLTRGTQVFQTFNNCGPASLSMALSHMGVIRSQQQLGQNLRPYQNPTGDNDDKSVTLAELALEAQEYGFITYHRPAGTLEQVRLFIAYDIPVITRTWLNLEEDIGHYRVIKGYDQVAGVLIQDDSLQGANLRYSYADYQALWRVFNYEYLVLVPPEKQEIALAILGPTVDEQYAWRRALEIAEQSLVQDPDDPYAEFNKSIAYYHLGQYDQAIHSYQLVADELPFRMLWYQIEPILAYYHAGQHDQVLAMTEQILTNHNRAFSELHQLRGQIFQARGDQPAAEAAFAQATQYNAGEAWKVNIN